MDRKRFDPGKYGMVSLVREKDQSVGVLNLRHSETGALSRKDKLALSYKSNQVGTTLTSFRVLDIQETNRFGESRPFSEKKPALCSTLLSSPLVAVLKMSQENGMFICASEKMHRVKEMVDQVANTDVTVLIQGETGVGKEVVARYIHLNSFRKDKPFVKVNCAALPHELLESELFGFDKGAFTGAYCQKPGKFELADGGTIFLDEIAEIGPSLQAKLLHVLQDRTFSRLGGKNDIRVDARVIAASNKNIEEATQNKHFRQDLYYRLNVVTIAIPPLRERIEEIPILVEYLLDKFGKKYNKTVQPLSERMKKALLEHHWFGNIRELENVVQRIVVLRNEDAVIDDLVPGNRICPLPEKKKLSLCEKSWSSLKEVKREVILKTESEVIRKALELTNWNRKKASSLLGISYKALLYKIKTCGLMGGTLDHKS